MAKYKLSGVLIVGLTLIVGSPMAQEMKTPPTLASLGKIYYKQHLFDAVDCQAGMAGSSIRWICKKGEGK